MERAAAADEEPKPVLLSPLEEAFDRSHLEDFSPEALEAFRSRARIPDEVTSPAFQRLLVGLGLVKPEGRPTGFGMLLFGKQPRNVMPQAAMLGTIHRADGREETRDFDGPQILVPEQAIQWLRDKLPEVLDRSDARRRSIAEPLFEIVREGIVNALVHRDYGITGAKSHLIVTPDTVEIRSPGEPVRPLTLEQLQSFDAPMLSRNPVPHYVFSRMELAEERGLGLKSIRDRAQSAGLPLPAYSWNDPYLVLRILRDAEAATRTLPENVRSALSPAEREGWQWFTARGTARSSQYALALRIDDRVARRHLTHFVELGLARKSGVGRATAFEVIR